jgi:hypothetical protein
MDVYLGYTGSTGTATIEVVDNVNQANQVSLSTNLILAAGSAAADPAWEIVDEIPVQGPDGETSAPVRSGVHRGPHKGWGRTHVEQGRQAPWDEIKPKIQDAVRDPARSPTTEGTARSYVGRNGWKVKIEWGQKDSAGRARGLITGYPKGE